MNREQMIAWLTLEGWVLIRIAFGSRPAHWIEHPDWGTVYCYLCDDEPDLVTDSALGWWHTSPSNSSNTYVLEDWSTFPAGHIALLYEEVQEKAPHANARV